MTIEIVWPEPLQIPVAVIEEWFMTAIRESLIPSRRLSLKTPQDMAEALEDIGWIVLASKQLL